MKKGVKIISLGSDPEVFLKKNSEFISSEVLGIPGDKYNPFKIVEGLSILKDNVMLEFNIPISYTKEEFVNNIKESLLIIKDFLGNNIEISEVCSVNFPIEQLMTEHAQTFGCEPDFNCWTLEINKAPCAKNKTLRTAGGHIHVGYENPDEYKSITLLRLMDLYLGVPSILLDKDTERRKMYGKAGCYRFKHYGFEYRVLSNFWIFDSNLVSWVWESTEKVFDIYNNLSEKELESFIKSFSKDVIKCINNSDKKLAEKLIKTENLLLV
ncbi:MAG: hypothetical protein QXL18_05545 [Candidatus Woesearchaeota archaeon]